MEALRWDPNKTKPTLRNDSCFSFSFLNNKNKSLYPKPPPFLFDRGRELRAASTVQGHRGDLGRWGQRSKWVWTPKQKKNKVVNVLLVYLQKPQPTGHGPEKGWMFDFKGEPVQGSNPPDVWVLSQALATPDLRLVSPFAFRVFSSGPAIPPLRPGLREKKVTGCWSLGIQ